MALEDEDVMHPGDVALGYNQKKEWGWWPIPPWLEGQTWCEAAIGIGHPDMVKRYVGGEG